MHNPRRGQTLAALAALLLFSGVQAPAQTPWYSVTDLGAMTDSNADVAAVSLLGRICGTTVTGGVMRAALYRGAWTNLGTLGGTASRAMDVTDAGQVAGTSRNAGGVDHAFLWTPGGTNGIPGNPQMRDLGAPAGASSEGVALNASGQVAAYWETATNARAARITGSATNDIGALLPAYAYTYAVDINATGLVAVTAYNDLFDTARAFLYNGTSVALVITAPAGMTTGVYAADVNDAGHVTGEVDDIPNYGFSHVFRYTGAATNYLTSLGGDYSYAAGLNNEDVIVGGSYVDVAATIYHAFVAVSNAMVDLNTRLDRSGAGWVLVEARDINDLGQIVGMGLLSGVRHGFLLTPTPLVTNVAVSAADLVVTFTAASNVAYTLQGAADPAGPWSNLMPGLVGSGFPLSVTNPGGAGATSRYFRVR